MISNVDLYMTRERDRVVLESDPDAAALLVNAGRDIPEAEIVRLVGAGGLAMAKSLGVPAEPAPTPSGRTGARGGRAGGARRTAPPNDKSVGAEESKPAGDGTVATPPADDDDDEPHTAESLGELSDDDLLELAPEGFAGSREELVAAILEAQSADGGEA